MRLPITLIIMGIVCGGFVAQVDSLEKAIAKGIIIAVTGVFAGVGAIVVGIHENR